MMADSKNVEAASAGPGEKRSAARPKASESGDPAVHKALGDLYTAQQNQAAAQAAADDASARNQGHEEQVAAAKAALAELGYE